MGDIAWIFAYLKDKKYLQPDILYHAILCNDKSLTHKGQGFRGTAFCFQVSDTLGLDPTMSRVRHMA